MLTTDERQRARANIEVAIDTTLNAMGADSTAILHTIETSDLDISVVTEALEAVCRASDIIRNVRDAAEANVRADAIEAAERITQAQQESAS